MSAVRSIHQCPRTKRAMLCGQCDACMLEANIRGSKVWYPTLEPAQQLKLLVRLMDVNKLANFRGYVATILSPMLGKDVVYALGHRRSSEARFTIKKSSSKPSLTSTSSPQAEGLVEWYKEAKPTVQCDFYQRILMLTRESAMQALKKQIDGGSKNSTRMDIVSNLPGQLARFLLGFLSPVDLCAAAQVSKRWHSLVRGVNQEHDLRREAQDFIRDLEATCDLSLCQKIDYPMPMPSGGTRAVVITEKNVFCGSYSVITFETDPTEEQRTMYFGGTTAVSGSPNKLVKVWNAATGKVSRAISGHAGSIRAVFVDDAHGIILSAGFDTTIRCWDLKSGACTKVFRGHMSTICCLDSDPANDVLVSGCKTGTVKVWSLKTHRCLASFSLGSPVTCVKVYHSVIVASCEDGTISVYDGASLKLRHKYTAAHKGRINSMSIDSAFITSGGDDKLAHVYPTPYQPNQVMSSPIKTFRHTSVVNSVGHHCLRVITGCADGKLRVWSMSDGLCIRILRGNSLCHPIINFVCPTDNQICINTTTSMQVMEFSLETQQSPRRDLSQQDVLAAFDEAIRRRKSESESTERFRANQTRKSFKRSESFSGKWRTANDGSIRRTSGLKRMLSDTSVANGGLLN